MGIGLKLCRSIVESHQGRMQAENLYNGEDVIGCRFTFWIPVTPPPVHAAAIAETGPEKGADVH